MCVFNNVVGLYGAGAGFIALMTCCALCCSVCVSEWIMMEYRWWIHVHSSPQDDANFDISFGRTLYSWVTR